MSNRFVRPVDVARGLPKGNVVVLHSPRRSTLWRLYGEVFHIAERYESDSVLRCRCVGAQQFGGRVLVIHKDAAGEVYITIYKKNNREDVMVGTSVAGARQVTEFFQEVEGGKKPFKKENATAPCPERDIEHVPDWERELEALDQENE